MSEATTPAANGRTHHHHSPRSATACFTVCADAGPGMLGRLLEGFAKRGLTPERVHAQLSGDGETMDLDLQVTGLDGDQATIIGETLRAIVGVRAVLVGAKATARPIGVAA
ncbi:hypothetical protein KAJ83_17990 [Marivibrio halodurans]|uniref:ACT domain-containing protein n=1 Tax=Marivibrio halodurans TaxID=2039722 RepID=A0A8J7V2K6_9PROT|nr:hypothetical protein [Marivibrio halodurans]MBP5858916.1 hypothetical protein [Marivibrio halodurans]